MAGDRSSAEPNLRNKNRFFLVKIKIISTFVRYCVRTQSQYKTQTTDIQTIETNTEDTHIDEETEITQKPTQIPT